MAGSKTAGWNWSYCLCNWVTDPAAIADQWRLIKTQSGLSLCLCEPSVQQLVRVDFSRLQRQHRGHNELLIKALGVKMGKQRFVIDATAGMGSDAFLLAQAGCRLTMIERVPLIASLLEDGVARALTARETREAAARMTLMRGDAIALIPELAKQQQIDMIYLDPMFASRKKSALPKKTMQHLQSLVGDDHDQSRLLEVALQSSRFRVVVKRHAKAEAIAGAKPSYCVSGKLVRYDVYALRKLA